LLDGRNGVELHRFRKGYYATTPPALSRDGRVVVVKTDPLVSGVLHGFDAIEVATGKNLGRVRVTLDQEHHFALSPDGRALVFFRGGSDSLTMYDIPIGP
jgi:hypothetical protein